ncbi:hypothetical protein G9G63_25650 [Paenibacillus sp. EKM202P]|uniref:hypothetical protein n=1 Tax=unclassified Paenibacillus TaxID=185978 RepID=UPI0013EDDA92|nr:MULTISPECIES: hypothetical protein [unclassified Paenibacillus]KAF6558373.1 hypothetical protein G9G63_25650 [Paenibacillus sp. EKM202P]KAF6563545.1 hypothetical protein G9G64_25390 [Paenibacillus sp. EKM207P]
MVNSKIKKIGVNSAIFVTLTIIFVCSYQVYQNVETVHNYFSPKVTSVMAIEKDTDEWNSIKFDGQDSIKFDSVFWKKTIINDANSAGNAHVRVKDEKGDIVIDEFQVSPGNSKQLNGLNNDKQYYFEIKAAKGQFIINAV